MYLVEWQKRGLPHAHILIWLEKPILPNRVDQVICAELPDSQADLELSNILQTHMLHGPCGAFSVRRRQLPCVKVGHCSKKYPRPFVSETRTGDNGYPTYRRRAPEYGGHHVLIKVGSEYVPMDNRRVVPYSPVLSRTFKTHVNVEYCSSVKSNKYICKYVNKGTDHATFAVSDETDEIQSLSRNKYPDINMPRKKKSSLSRVSKDAKRMKVCRSAKDYEGSESVEGVRPGPSSNTGGNEASTSSTSLETYFVGQEQPSTSRERVARFKAWQSEVEREKCLARDREWHAISRKSQSEDNREARLVADTVRHSLKTSCGSRIKIRQSY
ncbi:uncharacterized protein LOC106470398 [Limulus polyphemus]|uniref:Uncharacterized protein LOC106470398 n=1 Tax=Limulus polyphemus TaxID=6850 RepID=A0ABM1BPY4_LIMPO|nr:uncharacterized protein LOC106470398 [Limulus polyphemus]